MTKTKIGLIIFLTSILSTCLGWAASEYRQLQLRKAQSIMSLVTAHDAAENGNYDMALEYASYALAYDKDSPLAAIQIRESTSERAKRRCVEFQPGSKESGR